MITLIVTTDDDLYERLASRVQEEGDTPLRATNVLDGSRLATTQPVGTAIVDMSVYAADTLVEMLRSRELTRGIPLFAVVRGGRLPFELRRLCTDVLDPNCL